MGSQKLYSGQGIGGGDVTIDELVRKSAISSSRKRKASLN